VVRRTHGQKADNVLTLFKTGSDFLKKRKESGKLSPEKDEHEARDGRENEGTDESTGKPAREITYKKIRGEMVAGGGNYRIRRNLQFMGKDP